ncbi:Serine/threonine-protein kinase PknD [Pirellulimonas nuda]|uniref:Serine/threonine-protein kinase PknD n=1 Tax=Pirellulimonas nuda TaxID=2528009 RepID=A0A518D958_9BACT|nr:serine/threonine-protein kinase [Pirellulimonas nuda]QDU88002.1 Serine/threonine-protein kinase PknD [Pirellulimonas nuda]
MPQTCDPRGQLFVELAVRCGLIDAATASGVRSGVGDGGDSAADWLVDRGSLSANAAAALHRLVECHIESAGGSVDVALAAIAAAASPAPAAPSTAPDMDTATVGPNPAHDPLRTQPPAAAAVSRPAASESPLRFRRIRAHAQGGLGRVSLAEDRELGREVALKELLDHHADDQASRVRFLREASITGRLEHPGIVPVYGMGYFADGRPYYAMRMLRGRSLLDDIRDYHSEAGVRSRDHQLRLRQLLERFRAVCDAIQYAHQQGVVHRDLKPANIMSGEYGETLVVDWGLAKQSDDAADDPAATTASSSVVGVETLDGAVIGTPCYMSPEQAAGRLQAVGEASDIYSLGATLYHLLTGTAPLTDRDGGGSNRSVLERAIRGEVTPPRVVNPRVPKPLAAVCGKAMALNPADRYGSAADLARDVERWMADEPVSADRESLPQLVGRWARRHKALARAAAAALAAIVLIGAASAVMIGRAQDRVRDQQAMLGLFFEPPTEANVDRLLSLASASGAKQQEYEGRVASLVGDDLRAQLEAPRIDSDAAERFQASLASYQSLFSRHGSDAFRAQAPALNDALALRRADWNTLVDYAAGSPTASQRLPQGAAPAELVSVNERGLPTRRLQEGAGPEARRYAAPVPIKVEGGGQAGDTAVTATLEAGWRQASAVGLTFETDLGVRYDFLVTSPQFDSRDRSARAFKKLPPLADSAELMMHVRRDNSLLSSARVRAPDGPITLRAQRDGDRLQLEFNGSQRIAIEDPFYTPSATPDAISLMWPPGAALSLLQVSYKQAPPQEPSPMEEADRLYAAGRLVDAERAYAEIDGVEAAYKRAVCLEVTDYPSYLPALRAIVDNPDPNISPDALRWEVFAVLRLTVSLLEHGDLEEANLRIEDSADEIRANAQFIPEQDRRNLLAFLQQSGHAGQLAIGSQDDSSDLELALSLQALWGAAPADVRSTQLRLAQTHHVNGRYQEAAKLLTELLRQPEGMSELERVLIVSDLVHNYIVLNRLDVAQEVIKSELLAMGGQPLPGRLPLLLDRARVWLALGQPDAAAADLDAFLDGYDPQQTQHAHVALAALMRGVLHQRQGADAEAMRVWRSGLLQNWRGPAPDFSNIASATGVESAMLTESIDNDAILLCWTDALKAADIDQLLDVYVGGMSLGTVALRNVLETVDQDVVRRALLACHTDPRYRVTAEASAFRAVPSQVAAEAFAASFFTHALLESTFQGETLPEEFWGFAVSNFGDLIEGYRKRAIGAEDMKSIFNLWRSNRESEGWNRLRANPELSAPLKAGMGLVFGRADMRKGKSLATRFNLEYALQQQDVPDWLRSMAEAYLAELPAKE